jgi:hypothetical protein
MTGDAGTRLPPTGTLAARTWTGNTTTPGDPRAADTAADGSS